MRNRYEYAPCIEDCGEVWIAQDEEMPHYWGIYRRPAGFGRATHIGDVLTHDDALAITAELNMLVGDGHYGH